MPQEGRPSAEGPSAPEGEGETGARAPKPGEHSLHASGEIELDEDIDDASVKKPAPPPPPPVNKRAPPTPLGVRIPPAPRMTMPSGEPRASLPNQARASTPTGEHRASMPALPTRQSTPSGGLRASSLPMPANAQRKSVPAPDGRVPIPSNDVRPAMRDLSEGHTERITLPDGVLSRPSQSTLEALPAIVFSIPPLADAATALIARCEAELTENPSPQRAGRLHFEIARLCEYPIRDVRRASVHYQQAYDRMPDHVPTIRGLRRTLIARKALKHALPLFDAEARLTSDPRPKAKLLLAKGRLLEDGLALRPDAHKAYRAALDLDPSDASLLEAMEQAESSGDEWAELAQTYAKQANSLEADPKQRAALLIRRAQLMESKLQDSEGALAQYETALDIDPDALDALEALKRLYHSRGRFRDLVRALEIEALRGDDLTVRTTALYQIARIQSDKLGNRPDAVSALERAVEAAPTDRLLLDELALLKEASRDYRGLATVLAQRVEVSGEGSDQAGALHRIGQLFDEHLSDPETARLWFERALEIDPCYLPALQALGNLYSGLGAFVELVGMHLAEAEATGDSSRRAAAHSRVAEIYELKLRRIDDALDHHGRALAAVPIYAPSFKALTRLYAQLKRYRQLVELYERAVEHAEPERTITYLLKIGGLYEDHLGDPVQAIHSYRRILDRDARYLGAIHALQRVTETAGRYGELVEALILEAELTTDRAHKAALFCRAGEVLDEQLNDREAAVAILRRVVSIDPRYVPALTSLGRMYYRAGRWEDLLSMYQAELTVLGEEPRALPLLLKMAELTEHRLGRHAEATELYRRAVILDPASSSAKQAFIRKLREQGKWDDLLDVLAKDVKTATTPERRAASHFQIAEVLEYRLARQDAALDAYEKVLTERPDHRPAREAQLRLRALRGDHAKLVEELLREAAKPRDPAHRVCAMLRAGETLRDQLRDLRRAIACFEEVLAIEPSHHGALIALDALYRKTGQWTELASVLAAQSRYFSDVDTRATALRELVRVEMRGDVDRDTLRGSYESILMLVPDDVDALSGLEVLALGDADAALLVSVDERVASSSPNRSVRAAHLTRLAELIEAENPDRALEVYRAALETEPENLAATRGLSRLAERTEEPEVLASAARREADVLRDKVAASRLWVRAALSRRKAGQDERAVATDLERALELEPDSERAAYHLSEALLSLGDVQRLSDQLARAASVAVTKERAAALFREVARLYADQIGNVAGAISALNRGLRHSPDDVRLISELANLFRRDGQWNEASALLGRVVTVAKDPILLRDAHTELAVIHDERLGDADQALRHLRSAVKLDPEHRPLLERLSDLLSREDEHAEAITVAQRLVDTSRMPQDRVSALLHLARIERRRNDLPSVARALMEAVSIDGPAGGAGAAFRESIGVATTYENYGSALRKYILSLRSSIGAPADVYLELARLQANELKNPKDALATLREVLAKQPGNLTLRVEHAKQLLAAGALDEAANELRLLLVLDVERAQTWLDLGGCFEAMGRLDAKQRVRDALSLLGGRISDTRPSSDGRGAQRKVDLGRVRAAAFAGPVLDDLSGDLLPFGVAGDLLVNLAEGLSKLYPADLDSYGVTSRDRLAPRSGHPFRNLAERIAEIVGAGEFELYVHRARNRGIGVELAETPTLVFPAWLLEYAESHQTFALARVLSLVARNCHAVLKLTPRELEVVLAAYTRTMVAGFGRGLTSEDLIEDQGRKIYKALSRRARKAAEDIVQRYVSAPAVDFVKWSEGRDRLATRTAALLCDDLSASLEGIVRARTEAPSRSVTIDLSDESSRDLLRFWVSDAALRARTRAGLGG